MAWTSEKKAGSYTPPPVGSHYGICVGIYEIGTQVRAYQGKTSRNEKVVIMFELPYQLTEENKPFTISGFYTLSLYEKAHLRRHLTAWYGRPLSEDECRNFDPRALLGAWAQIIVAPGENGKVGLQNIINPGDLSQYSLPVPTYTPKYFSIHQWDQEVYESLPAGIRRMIDESEERRVGQATETWSHFQAPAAPAPVVPAAPAPAPAVAPRPTAPGAPGLAQAVQPAAPVPQPVAAPAAPPAAPRPAAPGGPMAPSGSAPRPQAGIDAGIVEDDIPF